MLSKSLVVIKNLNLKSFTELYVTVSLSKKTLNYNQIDFELMGINNDLICTLWTLLKKQ